MFSELFSSPVVSNSQPVGRIEGLCGPVEGFVVVCVQCYDNMTLF